MWNTAANPSKKISKEQQEYLRKEVTWQHPKWLALAKQVKNERNNTCERCGKMSNFLRLHHVVYASNLDKVDRDVWDYPIENFICLCKECHEKIHGTYQSFRLSVKDDDELKPLIEKLKNIIKTEDFPHPVPNKDIATNFVEELEDICKELKEELDKELKGEVHPLFRTMFNNARQENMYTCNISSEKDQVLFLSGILDSLLSYNGPGKRTAGISVKFCIEVIRDLARKDKNLLSSYLTTDFLEKHEKDIWVKDRR